MVDLEDRGVRVIGVGSGEEGRAVGVISSLIVVLDVPPVDSISDGLGNSVISPVGILLGVVREPRSYWGMGNDVF